MEKVFPLRTLLAAKVIRAVGDSLMLGVRRPLNSLEKRLHSDTFRIKNTYSVMFIKNEEIFLYMKTKIENPTLKLIDCFCKKSL